MIQLNYRSGRPIYEQVKDALRQMIISGAIQPDEKLPSVRMMAGDLAINPNTIQKAYEALEAEGYAYTVAGKGSFAAARDDAAPQRREELLKQLDAIAEELRFFGMTDRELTDRVTGGESK